MNNFDLIILAVMLLFTAIGAWRGLVSEVITLLSWVLSCLLAWLFAGKLSAIFKGMVDDPALSQLLAFVLIFIVVFVLGMVASWFIHKHLPGKRGFRIANLALGGLIGAARRGVCGRLHAARYCPACPLRLELRFKHRRFSLHVRHYRHSLPSSG